MDDDLGPRPGPGPRTCCYSHTTGPRIPLVCWLQINCNHFRQDDKTQLFPHCSPFPYIQISALSTARALAPCKPRSSNFRVQFPALFAGSKIWRVMRHRLDFWNHGMVKSDKSKQCNTGNTWRVKWVDGCRSELFYLWMLCDTIYWKTSNFSESIWKTMNLFC